MNSVCGKNKNGGENLTVKTKIFKNRLFRSLAFLMSALALLVALPMFASAASAEKAYGFPDGAVPVKVTLDTKEVLKGESVIINSTTYVPLRSLSELVHADSISWDAKTSTATVKKGETTLYVRNGGFYLEAQGRYFYTPEGILNINDRLFVPIRPFAKVFCLDLNWNAETRTVELFSTTKTLARGSSFYDSTDLYWLSRIIHAEASGESLAGKIAVGNVVLNRVRSRSYPNTVKGVIFDKNGGTQFSPVSFGTIYNTPSEASVIAAKICLEGYSISDRILFFMNPRIATNSWISRNRPFAFRIGNHNFYY
ncbi:MAG: copper amine oxidase [Ruminococcaceae bacterium]|nr:copper amine oxidase [Oscillospiraceae bacterium]